MRYIADSKPFVHKAVRLENSNFEKQEYSDTNKDIYTDKIKRYENLFERDLIGQFKEMQDSIMKREIPILSRLLAETSFDSGYESLAETYFRQLFEKYGLIACAVLQNIYLKNMYNKPNILKHLLFIVGNMPEDECDNLIMIPLAGISNPDIEIQDLSVKCFEEWGDKEHIPTLVELRDKTNVSWFKEYVNDVITELNEG